MARRVQRLRWASLLAVLCLLIPLTASGASLPGTAITNTAEVSYRQAGSDLTFTTRSNTARTVTRTPSVIEILKFASGVSDAEQVTVPPTAFRDGNGELQGVPLPVPFGAAASIIPGTSLPLAPAEVFHRGEPLFIRLTDLDQNLDPARLETVDITVLSETSGDTETLRLSEISGDSGVFAGYISTTLATSLGTDGVLNVAPQEIIRIRYTDVVDGSDLSISAALVDPFGIVFDSRTGQPVNGVTITLIDEHTGQPATVFGDDGVSSYPATLTSGGSATDSSGRNYNFISGGYRFPLLQPGRYRLEITPPAGYAIPSVASDQALQALPGGPFAIVTPGSRGEPFDIDPGPAIHIDIPADPFDASLWVRKQAGRPTAAVGDFLPYTLIVESTTAGSAAIGVTVEDRLPPGLRYQRGSATLDGAPTADPMIGADGRTLQFSLGDLPADERFELSYVTEVAAGTRQGKAVNTAVAGDAFGNRSNTASATVQIVEELLGSHSTLTGQVHAGGCGTSGGKGLAGVRIFLEDGSYSVTDDHGRYHFEGIRPGVHVVQLDLQSLPVGYELVPCELSGRFAGRSFSQFIDLQPGSLWRADFYAAELPPPSGEVTLSLEGHLIDGLADYRLDLAANGVPASDLRLTVLLPEGASYRAESSSLAGKAITDPEIRGAALTWRLGDVSPGWAQPLRFSATVAQGGDAGELPTKALLLFNSPTRKNQRTPMAETLFRRVEHRQSEARDFVLYPLFPTFVAKPGPADLAMLDQIIAELAGHQIRHVKVVGHTDNVRIAPRNRHLYRDNFDLAKARAESIASYLAEHLQVPREQMTVVGMGAALPVADNATPTGRARNRRVELQIQSEQVHYTHTLEPLKQTSGPQAAPTLGKNLADLAAAGVSPRVPAPAEQELMPAYDRRWLSRAQPGTAWLWPHENEIPLMPSTHVAIKVPVGQTVALQLNGAPVNPINFEGILNDRERGIARALWRGIDLVEGDNELVAVISDAGGAVLERLERTVHYSSPPVDAQLVEQASRLVADGLTPVVLAVRLLDKSGHPVQAGIPGRFEVLPPHRPLEAPAQTGFDGHAGPGSFVTEPGGIARVQLRPTAKSGEAAVSLKLLEGPVTVRAWLQPQMREWVLVGLAEGTAGYNTASGNMETLDRARDEEHLYRDGRIAFFAKGQIRGKWLLTMAYDSQAGNDDGTSLKQQIDPNAYYPLYGDASEQGYEAASARKLYVKLEREQFYALFGDFDTGLTVTELSNYSRSVNGLKTELKTDRFELTGFASDTRQAYVRDEIRGDGTSGLYRLSKPRMVVNSDKISIETRDRFHSERVLDTQELARHIDYEIDALDGTLFFKRPVPSRDESFNPVYIVAEYEVRDSDEAAMNYGGRGAVKTLGDRLEVGASFVHEGTAGGEGDLFGLDATMKLADTVRLKVEAASSDVNRSGNSDQGAAYLAEVQHTTERIQSRAYVRSQETDFGLGQQPGSEAGTRKWGAETTFSLTRELALNGQLFRQDNLDTGARRTVAEGTGTWQARRYKLHLGMRRAEDVLGTGSQQNSTQLLAGGSWTSADTRLTLRTDHEQSLGDNGESGDYPTRTTLAADYRLSRSVTMVAEQEFARGEDLQTDNTRLGLKTSLWSGARANTSLGRQGGENGDRLFALYGLYQNWKIDEHWSVDVSLDRSHTLSAPQAPLDIDVPAASGGSEDFTAVGTALSYTSERWSWWNQLQLRDADSGRSRSFTTGLVGELRPGVAISSRLQAFWSESISGSDSTSTDLGFGFAYRPLHSRWIILERMNLFYDRNHGGNALERSWRVVNNLSANLRLAPQWQLSLLYGSKFVNERLLGSRYRGYTDLLGFETRYHLSAIWDIGFHTYLLHSWNSGTMDYSYGASLGYTLMPNTWLSLGYNLAGFRDEDFSGADYTAQGPYMRFRVKFDQQSVKDAAAALQSL